MTTAQSPDTRRAPDGGSGSARGLGRPIAMAVVGVAVAVAVAHLLLDAAGADFLVEPPGREEQTVTAVAAAAIAAVATAVGGLLALAATRVTKRPDLAFVGIVVLGLLVMAAPPFAAADQALTIVALQALHVVAAVVALAVLLPPLRARARG